MRTVSLVPRKYQLWASHANFALNIYFSNAMTEIAAEKTLSISLKRCEINNKTEKIAHEIFSGLFPAGECKPLSSVSTKQEQ